MYSHFVASWLLIFLLNRFTLIAEEGKELLGNTTWSNTIIAHLLVWKTEVKAYIFIIENDFDMLSSMLRLIARALKNINLPFWNVFLTLFCHFVNRLSLLFERCSGKWKFNLFGYHSIIFVEKQIECFKLGTHRYLNQTDFYALRFQ